MSSREPARLKVVIDTSVLVAALLSRSGGSARIVELFLSGTIHNFYTDEVARELIDVLRRPKFALEKEKREHFVHIVTEASFLVAPLAPFAITKCRDPQDDKFLSLANQIEADYLVSLDIDLLDLRKIGKTEIVSPATFLQHKGKRGGI